MKPARWVAAAVAAAVIVVVWMAFRAAGPESGRGGTDDESGRPGEVEMHRAMDESDYVEYVGVTPELPVSFRYPGAWRLQEEAGQVERYRQVRVLGPRNLEDSYSAYFAVYGAPVTARGGTHQDLEAFISNYTAHLQQGAQVLADTDSAVAGGRARDLTVSFTLPPWHHRDLKPVEVPVQQRVILFERDRTLYQLTYSADAREYDRHAAVFEKLLKSFRIQ